MSTREPVIADGAQVSSAPDANLDPTDKKILDFVQSGFPLVSRPYAAIGDHTGVSEEEAFGRVRALRERGIVRRIGANFQSGRIGFRSTLCAAKVPPEKLEPFIAAVNAEPGVTHNYLRDHAYNVWFTYIGPSMEHIDEALGRIAAATGVDAINLPAARVYKIKVDFRMETD